MALKTNNSSLQWVPWDIFFCEHSPTTQINSAETITKWTDIFGERHWQQDGWYIQWSTNFHLNLTSVPSTKILWNLNELGQ